MMKYCVYCAKPNFQKGKYCSDKCKEANSNFRISSRKIYMRYNEDPSASESIREGKLYSKRMKECSVDCLLTELGDLE